MSSPANTAPLAIDQALVYTWPLYEMRRMRAATSPLRVADAAVIGAPCPEMGERVVAVIQPADWADATPEFAAELSAWARRSLSGIKAPRQFDFMRELPRHETGKLYKRLIRDEYWKDVKTA